MAELILLMGPTGSGKSVQGDRWAKQHGGVHLSSGELLRRDPVVAAKISDGKLFPSEEVQRVVGEALADVPSGTDIMLDGLPRTMSDVEWLEQELPKLGRDLSHVVLLELDTATIMKRLNAGVRKRSDDSPEAVEKKLEEFRQKTKAVVDYYEQRGLVARIDGSQDVDGVAGDIEAAIA